MDRFEHALQELERKGQLRKRRVVQGPQGTRLQVEGRALLCFASNDYLGLANHPDLVAAAQEALAQYGVGAAASSMVTGHSAPVDLLERELAGFLGVERVLHFPTGYMANLGIIPALVGRDALVFSDSLNHASLIDGIRLARPRALQVYPHGEVSALAQALERCAGEPGARWIITDAVFSMDGDLAPLPELLELAERYDAGVLVDDAHGFGVLGEEGRGSLSHWQLRSGRIVYMATLGKAAGVCGAFVGASADLMNWLLQSARTYLFTTGTPPVLAAAARAALKRISADEFRRERLRQLGLQLQVGLRHLPWRVLPSQSAIHPLLVGDNFTVQRLADQLDRRGIWVPGIRPPTVPAGTARLRISLSAQHQPQEVERLLAVLQELGNGVASAVCPSAAADPDHPFPSTLATPAMRDRPC